MDFLKLRNKMIEEQIIRRGITDSLTIEALHQVERHKFVPEQVIDQAYEDGPVTIGENQTISQPYMVALMTQWLDLNKEKTILEIGTGSGYQTALLAELSKEVYSIERLEGLFQTATQRLIRLGYHNVHTFLGDGTQGLLNRSQLFDGIIITAASPNRPDHLFAQLASQGRMVVPVGDRLSQRLMVFTKENDDIIEKEICVCTFVPLIGEYGWSVN